MPLGPAPRYLARYNSYVLPGYVQNESFDSSDVLADHPPIGDGSLSEYTGLENKLLSITNKVWEPTYQDCKTEAEKAATILRTKKNGFADLYLQYSDRHYEAMVKAITIDKAVPSSTRTLNYQVQFECKPWLISDATYTVSGTGVMRSDSKYHLLLDTDSVGRTIDHGGWTPTTLTMTGTNITVSGYTESGDFAGFLSIDGAVTNVVVNSYDVTTTIGGVNYNDQMLWADYRVFAGTGRTFFEVIGASTCVIEYQNRWHI